MYGFFPAINRGEDARAAFGLALANDSIGRPAAFLFHNRKGVLAEGGEHGTLLSCEGVDDHPAVPMFLQEFCPVGTAGEGHESNDDGP